MLFSLIFKGILHLPLPMAVTPNVKVTIKQEIHVKALLPHITVVHREGVSSIGHQLYTCLTAMFISRRTVKITYPREL